MSEKRILIVKTSSLGDLIHTFPALTDAAAVWPEVQFDWLVDASFGEVPGWHPGVNQVIQIDLRRWRRQGILTAWRQWRDFSPRLRQTHYDLIIDAQGLLKSAVLAARAKGLAVGYDRKSLREPIARLFYRQGYDVPRAWHAIQRTRHLFAQALDYAMDEREMDYGLRFKRDGVGEQVLLLHGSTWPSKLWPEIYWAELADLIHQSGFRPCLTWYAPEERLRAERILRLAGTGTLLPRLSLTQMAQCLAQSAGVAGVDSGLAHLAAAISVPAITLYGPTSTKLTGAMGQHQRNLSSIFQCAPCLRRECRYQGDSQVKPACYAELTPPSVWRALRCQMERIPT